MFYSTYVGSEGRALLSNKTALSIGGYGCINGNVCSRGNSSGTKINNRI